MYIHVYIDSCVTIITLNLIRFEAFNSLMRTQNVHGNRHAPSKDISHNFAVIEHLRFICSGGLYLQDEQGTGNHLTMKRYIY